ncbi:MAG: ABC transporter ATP-binding protein/permease, partial [Lachnospiraceae bacterium]|nr:ABC transporter ATP-binding protein/permease [Lachnospiraceae bacterium]
MNDRIPDFQTIFKENKGHNLRIMIRLYEGKYPQLIWSIVFFIIKHTPTWLAPLVLAKMIDIITNPGEDALRQIGITVVVMLVIVLQNIPTNYIHTRYYAKAIRQVEMELRAALVRKLQQLSITYHSEMESGRLQSKVMRDVEQIENLSTQFFISLLNILMNFLFAVVIVAVKNRVVFLFFSCSIPVAILLMNYFKGKIRSYNRDFRQAMEQTSVSVMEMVELIPVTRAHGLETVETAKVEDRLKGVEEKGYRLDMIQTYFGSISWVIFQVFQVVCLAFCAVMALRGRITVGDVALYQSYFSTIIGSVAGVIGIIPMVSKGLSSVESIGDILTCEDVEDTHTNRQKVPIHGEVVFEDVGFAYKDSEEMTFEHLNFTARPGETIAIVGASGAGKTTILNLIIGFLQPTAGRVLMDGRDLNSIDLHTYRKQLAVVPQSSILFTGTLRDNITYGLKDVDEEQLAQVLEASNLSEFIAGLPDGLDTMIREHGNNLSGGQRQRISIARAFLRNPTILILDEATSALDSASEHQIQEATDRLAKDRTTFIVAHRLSTIRGADKILVMGHGGLREMGSY